MGPRLIALLLVVSLAATAGAVYLATPGAAAASSSSTCNQSVTHDAYRSQAAIDAVNETGEASSTVSNTQTTVEDVTGFVRLRAENPNGYCVKYTVEISPEIVSAADLGEIESQDGNATASWRAAQNLSSGQVYTEVTFTLEPGQSVLFAPSSARVKSLAWTGDAKRTSQGVVSSIMSFLGGDDKLERSEYTISPANGSSRITVPLQSKSGQSVDDWQATYTLDGDRRPVGTDSSAPVYYEESAGAVTFHFSSSAVRENASVEFVADPGWLDKAEYSADGYFSGWAPIGDVLPFSVDVGEVIPG